MIRIMLPLEVWIQRKTVEDKQVKLNLNIYRNAHHYTLNSAKIEMANHVKIAVDAAGISDIGKGPWIFNYTVFPPDGRAFDLANVCSIVQKFTDDALIELRVIKDDNYKIVRRCVYDFGEIDKANPRAELLITNFGGK